MLDVARYTWTCTAPAERPGRFGVSEVAGVGNGTDSEVVAHLLAPVADRVARILLVAGPDAFVVTGAGEYQDVGRELARRLLEHHVG